MPQYRKWEPWSQRTWENIRKMWQSSIRTQPETPARGHHRLVWARGPCEDWAADSLRLQRRPFRRPNVSPVRPSLGTSRTLTDLLFGKFLQNPLRSQHCYYQA